MKTKFDTFSFFSSRENCVRYKSEYLKDIKIKQLTVSIQQICLFYSSTVLSECLVCVITFALSDL